MSKIYWFPNFIETCTFFYINQEELVALVWRPQESSPWEEPMWSLLLETQRLHQKQGRPSWRRTQQHVLMFWSLTSAPSSLSGLSRTSSTRWNFLWTSWCNPLHLLLCLIFFDIYEVCFALVKVISSLYVYSPILVLSSLHWTKPWWILFCSTEIMQVWCSALFNCLKMGLKCNSRPIISVFSHWQHVLLKTDKTSLIVRYWLLF